MTILKKRFVTYSSWAMGVESSWQDDNGNDHPYWIVYDKEKEKELAEMFDQRSHALDEANELNEKWKKGELVEKDIWYQHDE